MKKTIRTFVSAVLAIVIAVSTVSFAFASQKDPIHTWDGDEFVYAGELKEGSNSVMVNNDDYVYYGFNAENEGYYVVSYPEAIDDNEVAIFYQLVEEYNYKYECHNPEFRDANNSLFYFEQGDVELGVIFALEYDEVNADVKVEYLGSEITDISFPIGTDYPLINNYDVLNVGYTDEYIIVAEDITLTFDSGKSFYFDTYKYLYFDYNGEIEKGEITITFEFCDKEFTKTVTVAEVTDYVEKIELAEGNLSVVKYYDDYWNEESDPVFNVTYKDGSSVTALLDEKIDLKNGNPKTYYLFCRYSYYESPEEESLTGTVVLAGHDYLTLPVEVRDASLTENLSRFIDEVKYEFNYIGIIGEYFDAVVHADSNANRLRALGALVSFVNNEFLYAIGDVFEELSELITAYII